MKFYNRENEIAILKRADKLKEKHGIMTMLLGRRRVGKTALVLQPFSNEKVLYWFISKKSEALLCEEFSEEIESKLDVKIHGEIKHLKYSFRIC